MVPLGYFGALGCHAVHGGAFGWAGAITWWLAVVSFFLQSALDLYHFWIAAGMLDVDLS